MGSREPQRSSRLAYVELLERLAETVDTSSP